MTNVEFQKAVRSTTLTNTCTGSTAVRLRQRNREFSWWVTGWPTHASRDSLYLTCAINSPSVSYFLRWSRHILYHEGVTKRGQVVSIPASYSEVPPSNVVPEISYPAVFMIHPLTQFYMHRSKDSLVSHQTESHVVVLHSTKIAPLRSLSTPIFRALH